MILLASHQVPESAEESIRLSDYLLGLFPQLPTKNRIKKAIKKGAIRLNEEVVETGRWVKPGDVLNFYDLQESPPMEYPFKLEVVYEDVYLAVVWKPAGLLVSGNQYQTLANALSFNITPSQENDALAWPLPVHRLDFQTSGLVLVAKTIGARIKLGQLFENRAIQKTYQAVVVGEMQEKGCIADPIEGQVAETVFQRLNVVHSLKNDFLSLVELSPLTGRTHQLRIHTSNNGHPIVGDKLYGVAGHIMGHKGLFLSAIRLKFVHPILMIDMDINSATPQKFASLLNREERRWKAYHPLES